MGLCKCPRKKVTNQFCYEHRVNVCEFCMVSNHPNCIVQGYLQWLQDSDYDPTCSLCRRDLNSESCIRLMCYHVFHWQCLDQYCSSLPPTTAPAGYQCPHNSQCGRPIIPQPNVLSPVADVIRAMVQDTKWYRAAAGVAPSLPPGAAPLSGTGEVAGSNYVVPNSRGVFVSPNGDVLQHPGASSSAMHSWPSPGEQQNGAVFAPTSPLESTAVPSVMPVIAASFSGAVPDVHPQRATQARKLFSAPTPHYDAGSHYVDTVDDEEEDKYKRRSGFELVTRWLHSRALLRSPRQPRRRWFLLVTLMALSAFTIFYFLLRWGRNNADEDPFLDPRFNPAIRVEE